LTAECLKAPFLRRFGEAARKWGKHKKGGNREKKCQMFYQMFTHPKYMGKHFSRKGEDYHENGNHI
jgi:hypothetical protein